MRRGGRHRLGPATCVSTVALVATLAPLRPCYCYAREELRVRADAEFVNLGLVRSNASVEIWVRSTTTPGTPSPMHPSRCRSRATWKRERARVARPTPRDSAAAW